MDSLFHFVFPIIAALAARVHIKHPIRNILIAAFVALALDLDHFIGVGLERALFHNIFITILIPGIFLVYAFSLKKKYYLKGFAVLLLIFLSSHLILDVFTEPGVALFYPIIDNYYAADFTISIPLYQSQFATEGLLVSSIGMGILIFFLIIILPCLVLDEIIEIMEKKHEGFRKVVKDLIR